MTTSHNKSPKQRVPLDFWRNSSDDDDDDNDNDDVVVVTRVTPATVRPLVDEHPNHDPPRSSTRSRPAPRSNRVSLTPQLKAGTNVSSSTAHWDQELDDTSSSDDTDYASDDSSNGPTHPSSRLLRTKKNNQTTTTTTISNIPTNTTTRGGDAVLSSVDSAATSTRRKQQLRQNLDVKDMNTRGNRQDPEKGPNVQGSTRQQQEDGDGNPTLLGDDDDSSQDTDTRPTRHSIDGTSRKEPAGSPVVAEDDDSEDTATLTRRLRRNLVKKKDGVPPREIFTLSPSSSIDEVKEDPLSPHDNKVSSLPQRGGDCSSENEYAFDDTINDDQSVATAELVGRLKSNLGGPSTIGKVQISLQADSSSPKLASTFSPPTTDDDSEEDSLDRDNNMPTTNHHDCDDVVDDESVDTPQRLRGNNSKPQAFQLSIPSRRNLVQFELPSQSSSSSEDDGRQGSEADGGTSDWELSPNPPQQAPNTSGRRESHSKCGSQKLPSVAPASTARRLNQPPLSMTEASSGTVNKGRATVNPYTEKIKYTQNGARSSQQHLDSVMVDMSQPAQPPPSVFQSLPPALSSAPLTAVVPSHGTGSNRSDHGQHSVLEHSDEPATKCSSRDLYQDAFGVPRSPGRSCARSQNSKGTWQGYQHIASTTEHEPTNQQLYMEAFGGQGNSDGRTRSLDNSTVVLVDSDNDDDRKLPISYVQTNIHQGLRTEPRSPRFNIVSRTFPTKPSRKAAAQPAVDDEDHIGNFSSSSDDEYQPSAKVPRRNTRDNGMSMSSRRSARRNASAGQSSGTVGVIDSTIGIDHGGVVGRSGLVRPWTHTERPRIRDPTTSNPMNVASVASRQLQQHTRSSLGTTDRFGIASVAKQRSFLRQQRNDIVGGSGVGAAGFTFAGKKQYGDESTGQLGSEDGPVATPTSASRKTSGKASRRKGRTAKKTGTTRKRKVGGGRGGGWSGRRSRGGRGGGGDNVWGNDNQGGWQVSENFNSEDPAMKNIGGAEISF